VRFSQVFFNRPPLYSFLLTADCLCYPHKIMEIVIDNIGQNADPQLCAQKLEAYFKAQQHAIIAYSGGVDSALLAYAAHRALGDDMVAVLADSPSLARREYRFAVNFTQTHGMPLQIIRTREMENPKYQVNHSDRCYYCKKALFEKIEALRQKLQGSSAIAPWPVSYGVNKDDLGDFRPGIQAASEASITIWKSPQSPRCPVWPAELPMGKK